jgi:hypothetical protein
MNGLTMIQGMAEAASFCRNMNQPGLARCIEEGIQFIRDSNQEDDDPIDIGPEPPKPSTHIIRECEVVHVALTRIASLANQIGIESAVQIAMTALSKKGEVEELWHHGYNALVMVAAMTAPRSENLVHIAKDALDRMPKAKLRFDT